jgi:putative serine protease PepD
MPRQEYVSAADAKSFMGGNPHGGPTTGRASGGTRVTLGVVPDYSSDEIGGLRISGVVGGSPAEAAGLREGDVITRVGEKTIANIYDLTDVLANGKAGERVKIVVKRAGTETELQATLAEKG